MKPFILIFAFIALLAASFAAHAGNSGCSNSQTYTTPNTDVYLTLSDCVLSAQASSFGYIRFNLPSNPSVGDQFTLTENSTATQTDTYDCTVDPAVPQTCSDTYTGGTGLEAPVNLSIDGYQEYWFATPGWHVKVMFDGTKYTVIDEGPAA
jgi:hypothetical protein